ncbi:MAG: hypothetical protein GVY36_14340 [Verrucomicrobia bacterium]|jgi:hypothetical protein|nr:hypothetical protein [Verrucomicrobiota bacterium]
MYAAQALNLLLMVVLWLLATLSAFFLPPEVPCLLLLPIFPLLIYSIFNTAGDNNGDYEGSLSITWKVIFAMIFVFMIIYWKSGLYYDGKKEEIGVLDAFYFSVTTWTTLGYGDFLPGERMRHITSIQAIYGQVSMGVWIAAIGLWIGQRTERRRAIHEHNRKVIEEANKTEPVDADNPDNPPENSKNQQDD